MRALVTGSEGFIGRHLTAELAASGYEVIRCDINTKDGAVSLDIMDPAAIQHVLSEYRPDVIIHLAGQANVARSWKEPQQTIQLNTIGTVNLLEAVRASDLQIRILTMGSADEYGRLRERGTDVTEDTAVNPATPYAISKQAQELFSRLYADTYGMDICMIRLFNIGGAGQERGYILSDFASEIALVERGEKSYMAVGNLESARDFTHVRDACRALRLIAEKGHRGEVYNICSGKVHRIRDILNKMTELSAAEIPVRQDPARMRPSDTPVICGNHAKLTAHTGWEPVCSIDDILTDVLNYQRTLLRMEKS